MDLVSVIATPFDFPLQIPRGLLQVLHIVALATGAGDVLENVPQVETVMEEGVNHVNRFEAVRGLVMVWVIYPADGSSRIGLIFCQPSTLSFFCMLQLACAGWQFA